MRAWLEVDLGRLAENAAVVRRQVGTSVGLIGVLKADAYGHGIAPVASTLDQSGVSMYAVISLEEALAIRQVSQAPVLIMGYLDQKEMVEAISQGFILSLYDIELAPLYERLAQRAGKTARVHVKIETGLHRLGIPVADAIDFLLSRRHFPHIRVEALFSHLYNSADPAACMAQFDELQKVLLAVQGKPDVFPVHFSNSAALPHFQAGYFDAVRVGLAFYGVEPVLPGLEPTLTCKTVIVQVKKITAGDGVSYNHEFVAAKDMTIAVIAIGYAEGLSQALNGVATALVKGKEVPVIGKICMNLSIIDVTGVDVKRGDEVVLIGRQLGEDGQMAEIRVDELAKRSRLRHHEIITRLGSALPKQYLGG